MIDEPDLDVKGLLKHIKGPDFPTGGEILNTRAELREIYETGQGAVRLRGEYKVESAGARQAADRHHLDPLRRQQGDARRGDRRRDRQRASCRRLVDVRDESTDRRAHRARAEDATPRPSAAMAYLYKHTALQINFNVNLTCLLPTGEPRRRPAGARHAARSLPALPRLPPATS